MTVPEMEIHLYIIFLFYYSMSFTGNVISLTDILTKVIVFCFILKVLTDLQSSSEQSSDLYIEFMCFA